MFNSIEFQDKCGQSENSEAGRNKLVTLNWQGNRNTDSSSEVITLPVPYELPPQPYTTQGRSLALRTFFSNIPFPFFIWIFFSSPHQMFLGHGTGDIPRKMFMVKFGRGRFSCMQHWKILEILCTFNYHVPGFFLSSTLQLWIRCNLILVKSFVNFSLFDGFQHFLMLPNTSKPCCVSI